MINGFEEGIAQDPYEGIADMRNTEIITVPKEAATGSILTAVTKPPVMNAVAFTAQNTGDTITLASVTGLYPGAAIVLNTNSAGGITTGVVYYVQNIVGLTFQISLAPASTSAIAITSDGSGTLTTYQYGGQGSPVSYWVDRTGALAGTNATFVVDAGMRLWAYLNAAQVAIPANTLIYMGNIGTTTFTSVSGIAVWHGYFLLFTFQGIDIADTGDVWVSTGPAIAWDYDWEIVSTLSTNSRISVIVSQEDGNVYWTSRDGLGSIIETPGDNFNPTDGTSYTISDESLLLPESDEATCVAELGTILLIGGRNNFVYVWNKIDPGFSSMLNMPDIFISLIVATTANAYIFAGNRGRIYITNGSGINLYKKFPDYLTGAYSPFLRWQDASFGRNQLYFSLTGTTTSGTVLNTLAGIWAIDLDTDSLRLANKVNNTGYQGTVRMVAERPSSNSGTPVLDLVGNGLQAGWFDGSTTGIDAAQNGTPYTNYETYIELDMIPVGTYLDRFTPAQIEWKTSVPLGANGTNERIRISYRENLSDAFVEVGNTSATGTAVTGTTTGLTTGYAASDYYQVGFQNVQWVQLKVELASNSTTPTYNRLTEVRIRDWPSGKDSK